MAISETGLYKLTHTDLINMGFEPRIINPLNIQIYGNGGGMLPMPINEPRYASLMETAIRVVGEEDGTFDQEDYILFFALIIDY